MKKDIEVLKELNYELVRACAAAKGLISRDEVKILAGEALQKPMMDLLQDLEAWAEDNNVAFRLIIKEPDCEEMLVRGLAGAITGGIIGGGVFGLYGVVGGACMGAIIGAGSSMVEIHLNIDRKGNMVLAF